MTAEKIQLYISWRDDLLDIIGKNICKKCTDPRKNKVSINLEAPLKCECRCERIETVLTSASDIDTQIQSLINTSQ